ncbi:mirror-image polydactyly gene 1 protein isoform X2 [Amia ocellicauda]
MYKANPKVNEELKHRLPAPIKHQCRETIIEASNRDLSSPKRYVDSNSPLGQTGSREQTEHPAAESDDCQTSREPGERALTHLPRNKGEMSEGAGHLSQAEQGPFEPEQPWEDPEDSLESKRRRPPAQSPEGSEGRNAVLPPRRNLSPSPQNKAGLREDRDNTPASVSLTSVKSPAVLDQNKNIAFLLKELDSMRDLNKMLQDKLATKEKELEMLRIDAELRESVMEARVAEKAGALVEEIYRAQRERDQAVMARLRLANEERDEALLRAKQLQQATAGLENINPEDNDMDWQELLNRVNSADSALAIERSGAVLADRLLKTRERRKKITAEEMNAVIEERDTALAKCKRLEKDLHHLKEQSQTSANNTRHLTAENNQERAQKAELQAAQAERDLALKNAKKLEEEIQTLRVYYSLHQSLSQEASLKEQFDSTLSSYEEALRSKEGVASLASLHKDQLLAQLQTSLAQHSQSQAQLQQAQEAHREANEKVQKLERLVDVLRKKVGAGTVRTVI